MPARTSHPRVSCENAASGGLCSCRALLIQDSSGTEEDSREGGETQHAVARDQGSGNLASPRKPGVLLVRNFPIFTSRVTPMSMYRTALVAFLAFTTFAQRATFASNIAASPQAVETRSAPERVAADTPRVTPGGATFTVPSGWSIVTGKN